MTCVPPRKNKSKASAAASSNCPSKPKMQKTPAATLALRAKNSTAAVVPGTKSPLLVTADMVKGMSPGSVIVDLASERGGNCELTQPGEKIVAHGVTIIGWYNLASTVPYHASQMYARNVSAFLLHIVKDGKLPPDVAQDATRDTLLTTGGEIVNPRLREFYKLPPLVTASEEKR